MIPSKLLLFALFTQVLLTLIVMLIMGRRRLTAAKQKQIKFEQFKTMNLADAPEPVIQASRNFSNQFEIPVLFYVAALCAIAMNAVNLWFSSLACLFVLTRIIHSYIHIGSNNVLMRFRIYLFGCVVVFAQWLCLLFTVI
ncbi:MAPEG family protein (plasmid) [Pseudoalteromonas sp. T1lg65]|uniref:MAPEG family protein n=1 Tax=Pseudoalteromonas sp. T1lg65 TaxID=2077101 RepID=UPI003F793FF8